MTGLSVSSQLVSRTAIGGFPSEARPISSASKRTKGAPRPEEGSPAPAELEPGVCRSDDKTGPRSDRRDRKSTRLNSSHLVISYAVFCLKKKNHPTQRSPSLL